MGVLDQERRRYPRKKEAVQAWLSLRCATDALSTLTLDLGAEGAQFSTLQPIAEADPVLIQMQLGFSLVECKGRVCWAKRMANGLCHFGVRFLDLSPEDTDQVNQFLDRPSPVLSMAV